AIEAALSDAGMSPDQIDHINAHAASTPSGDLAEARAIHRVFGERAREIPVTSVKGAFGHCMAAAGALESVAAILTVHHRCIPPTLNYQTPDPSIDLNVVHGEPLAAEVHAMTKHSFGLGGQNAVLVLGRYEG
ncbi:MAG: beta-ketoacyl-[acyl-carrier-protein] synthase II, partial [Chloroflexia bacterium]|nr:beta-ketoacyl-[acyl-carrier-protein] synthase II [Chloroflexia bacterium]